MKPSVVRVSSLLVLIFLFWAAMGCAAGEQTCFQLYDRENERVLLEVPVQPGNVLRLEIEHSFEHIPWFEYYTVTEDGAFLLDTIAETPEHSSKKITRLSVAPVFAEAIDRIYGDRSVSPLFF